MVAVRMTRTDENCILGTEVGRILVGSAGGREGGREGGKALI